MAAAKIKMFILVVLLGLSVGCANSPAERNTGAPAIDSSPAGSGNNTIADCSPVDFPIPRATKPADVHMEALTGGELKLSGNCLIAGNHILVWPYGFKATKCG